MTGMLRIARARDTHEHLEAVLSLIEEARGWLSTKGTDQWAAPWPNRAQRDARVRRDEMLGATLIVWYKDRAAATVTVTAKPNPNIWSPADHDLGLRAVYVHRLIVSRNYAGWGLGTELIDWAGLRGRRDYGAKWIRINGSSKLTGIVLPRGYQACLPGGGVA